MEVSINVALTEAEFLRLFGDASGRTRNPTPANPEVPGKKVFEKKAGGEGARTTGIKEDEIPF